MTEGIKTCNETQMYLLVNELKIKDNFKLLSVY